MIDYRLGGWVKNDQDFDYVMFEWPLRRLKSKLTACISTVACRVGLCSTVPKLYKHPPTTYALCKWGHFEKKKPSLKCCWPLDFLMYFFKRFRSFYAKNLESVGQRTAKLLAVKAGGLKKKSATSAIPPKVCASVGLGSSTPGVQSFSKIYSQQLWSPLTYRTQIFSNKRSKSL